MKINVSGMKKWKKGIRIQVTIQNEYGNCKCRE